MLLGLGLRAQRLLRRCLSVAACPVGLLASALGRELVGVGNETCSPAVARSDSAAAALFSLRPKPAFQLRLRLRSALRRHERPRPCVRLPLEAPAPGAAIARASSAVCTASRDAAVNARLSIFFCAGQLLRPLQLTDGVCVDRRRMPLGAGSLRDADGVARLKEVQRQLRSQQDRIELEAGRNVTACAGEVVSRVHCWDRVGIEWE